jgi:hypothetical protein
LTVDISRLLEPILDHAKPCAAAAGALPLARVFVGVTRQRVAQLALLAAAPDIDAAHHVTRKKMQVATTRPIVIPHSAVIMFGLGEITISVTAPIEGERHISTIKNQNLNMATSSSP